MKDKERESARKRESHRERQNECVGMCVCERERHTDNQKERANDNI